MTRAEIEQCLREFLGVSQILWLGEGTEGDDTDGHIDNLARFVGERRVVAVMEADPASANYKPLKDNRQRLAGMEINGKPLEIIELPMPRRIVREDLVLPASYANFYIGNRVVLVPTYGEPNDQKVLEILGRLFPDRRMVGIDCRELIWGLGAFHCLTQQQPAVR
jgi:agmatine deiminase